jgi:pimeloyl-ACP methyl ester carboxylesterase
VQAAYPEIKNWFVGGHSLGGVVASSFAASHSDIRGVVLWASGPANDALKVNDVPTISIYGSNDGALSDEMKQDAKGLLPEGTKIVVIEGGNHAQFGSYGFQAGDREASISPEEQWSQAVAATVEFFKTTLSGN